MSWEEHFKRVDQLDTEDPGRSTLTRQFLDALGREFVQGHQIVENASDNEIELRGALNGLPARAKVDLNFSILEWEVRATNPSGLKFLLRFDEDAIPKAGAFTGAAASAWDDTATEKVFFGRGYHVEETKARLPLVLAIYEKLPPEVRQALATHLCKIGSASFAFRRTVRSCARGRIACTSCPRSTSAPRVVSGCSVRSPTECRGSIPRASLDRRSEGRPLPAARPS
jgi:hypothetical protein